MKSLIKEKYSKSPIIFDDSALPIGTPLSVERSQEIENLLMPKLTVAFEELKKKNPLFQKKPQNNI